MSPILPANLPVEVCLVESIPRDARSVWVWRVRLLGAPTQGGIPIYGDGDEILVRMRKGGVRPERKRFALCVPGRSPILEAGDDLQELVDRVLTQDALIKYVEYLVERYSGRLRTELLRDAGLYSYAMSL